MSGLKFNYKETEVYKIEKKLWQYSEAVVEWENKILWYSLLKLVQSREF